MRFLQILYTGLIIVALTTMTTHAQTTPYTPWIEENDTSAQTIKPLAITIDDLTEDISPTIEQESTPSPLETLYLKRIDQKIEQFGYNLFQNTAPNNINTLPVGQVGENYILSTGDIIHTVIRGQQNIQKQITIDTQGMFIIDPLPPIFAAGLSLGQLKQSVENEIQKTHNTDIYLSLAQARQINIMVLGHVKKPGSTTLSSFHTVLDALNQAGGIDKTGSLRDIKLIRDQKQHHIDLYQLLMMDGGNADKLLRDGDRIIVPPIGQTIAISGYVKRPAIYEIRRAERLTLHQAMGLAGGALTPGNHRYVMQSYNNIGHEQISEIDTPNKKLLGDGAVLSVLNAKQKRQGSVFVHGHSTQNGAHDLSDNKTLSQLLSGGSLLRNDSYPLIGVIKRRNHKTLSSQYIDFSPHQIIMNKGEKADQKLNDQDQIYFFSNKEILNLGHKNLDFLQDDQSLHNFVTDRFAFIHGAVGHQGSYPIGGNTTLETLLSTAGGLSLEADQKKIELTPQHQKRRLIDFNNSTQKQTKISAGDTIRVKQLFHKIKKQTVSIMGEVLHPGDYDITSGDSLHSLLERAGGLTKQAYPIGTIFSRKSERIAQQKQYAAQAQSLELKLAQSMQHHDDDKKPDATQINATQSLIDNLKSAKAIGRITVQSNPDILKSDPSQNILLEHGDRIYIPKRPSTIRVSGEVLSPAALQFKSGQSPMDYIRQAGGTTYYADKNRSYVIYPDGSAQPLNIGLWRHEAQMLPPGSTIIVPRDPKPFDFLDSAGRMAGILANLAVSGLYIEAIGDD